MNITQVKVFKMEDSKTLAFATITIDNDFVVTGLKVLDGKNGLWVAMPNRKDKDNEYHDIAFPVTREARETIQRSVLEKYQPFINETAEQVYNDIKDDGGIDVDEDDLPF